MSQLNHIDRFIFVHVAKTAGSSISSLIGGTGHSTLCTYYNRFHRGVDPFDYHGYFKFGFVRNPYDRIVSAWANSCMKLGRPNQFVHSLQFDEFIKKLYSIKDDIHSYKELEWKAGGFPSCEGLGKLIHYCPAHPCLSVDGELATDFTGRFENLLEDWNYISGLVGAKSELPHSRASARESWTEYYTNSDTRRMVEDLYQIDFEQFNYSLLD